MCHVLSVDIVDVEVAIALTCWELINQHHKYREIVIQKASEGRNILSLHAKARQNFHVIKR